MIGKPRHSCSKTLIESRINDLQVDLLVTYYEKMIIGEVHIDKFERAKTQLYTWSMICRQSGSYLLFAVHGMYGKCFHLDLNVLVRGIGDINREKLLY